MQLEGLWPNHEHPPILPDTFQPSKLIFGHSGLPPAHLPQPLFPLLLTITELEITPFLLDGILVPIPCLKFLRFFGHQSHPNNTIATLVRIIHSSPRLSSLSTYGLEGDMSAFTLLPGAPTPAANLQTFTGQALRIIRLAASGIHLPSLRVLDLSAITPPEAGWTTLAQHAPNVEHISTLVAFSTTPERFISVIRLFQKLTTLELEGPLDPYHPRSGNSRRYPGELLFDLLTEVHTGPLLQNGVCPLLSKLIIREMSMAGTSIRKFLAAKLEKAREWNRMPPGEVKERSRVAAIIVMEMWDCPDISNEDRRSMDGIVEAAKLL